MTEAEPVHLMVHPIKASRDKIADCINAGGFLTVAEGSVRSGKTCTLLIAFAAYTVTSVETNFLLSGRTVKTAEQNCILEKYGLLNLIPGSIYRKVGESRAVVFTVNNGYGPIQKKILVMGASDIRAYMALRGQTFGGWMADEVNMHDKEFVAEALRRTAVSHDRRHYFSLNPGSPRDWIYTEYLDRYEAMDEAEKAALGGYSRWLFTPEDNPAMTPEMLASLKAQYPEDSYLYRRYILGERCVAEGLVYPKVTASYFRDFDRSEVDCRFAALDFGADHPTVLVVGGWYKGNRLDWRLCAEYYDKGSDKTTYDHYAAILDMFSRLGIDPGRVTIAVDPAAKTMRLELIRHGLHVVKARNDVLPGIAFTRTAIYTGGLSFHSSMVRTLEEFGTYSWDEKAGESGIEKPVKLGDDCMDAVRYFAYTFMRPYFNGGNGYEDTTARDHRHAGGDNPPHRQERHARLARPARALRYALQVLHRRPGLRQHPRRRQPHRRQFLRLHRPGDKGLHGRQPAQVRLHRRRRLRPGHHRPDAPSDQGQHRHAARSRYEYLRQGVRARVPAQGQVRARFRRGEPSQRLRCLHGRYGARQRLRCRHLHLQGRQRRQPLPALHVHPHRRHGMGVPDRPVRRRLASGGRPDTSRLRPRAPHRVPQRQGVPGGLRGHHGPPGRVQLPSQRPSGRQGRLCAVHALHPGLPHRGDPRRDRGGQAVPEGAQGPPGRRGHAGPVADKDDGRDGHPGPPGPVRQRHPQVRHGPRPVGRAVRRQRLRDRDGIQDVRHRPEDGREDHAVPQGLRPQGQALRLEALQPVQRLRLRAEDGHGRHRHPLPVQRPAGPLVSSDVAHDPRGRGHHVQADREDADLRHPGRDRGGRARQGRGGRDRPGQRPGVRGRLHGLPRPCEGGRGDRRG